MLFEGKEILYYIGAGVVDTSCCGTAGCIYAYVPGVIRERISPAKTVLEYMDGSSISKVACLLKKTENISQAIFLTETQSVHVVV